MNAAQIRAVTLYLYADAANGCIFMHTADICLFDDMKGNDLMKNIHEMKIGMVGFGHLGSSIAEALIKGGFPKSNLMISYRGSRATMDRVSGMKLESGVKDPKYLMKYSDIVILAARPQNIKEIAQNYVRKDTLIISFMAALPLSALNSFFDCSISRAMCSGPETISGGRGICVLHHGTDAAGSSARGRGDPQKSGPAGKTGLADGGLSGTGKCFCLCQYDGPRNSQSCTVVRGAGLFGCGFRSRQMDPEIQGHPDME